MTRPVKPDEFSNTLAGGGSGATRPVTLIGVLDPLNTSFVDQGYARKELWRFWNRRWTGASQQYV